MKWVTYYPAGHTNEGEIVAVFHEHYGPDGTETRPPDQFLSDGTQLGISEESDSAIPDPPNFTISNWSVDVAQPSAYKK